MDGSETVNRGDSRGQRHDDDLHKRWSGRVQSQPSKLVIVSPMLLTLEISDRFDGGRTFGPGRMIAGHGARSGSRGHAADAVKGKQRRDGGGRDDSRSCFLVTAAGLLGLGQGLTGSAVPAGVTLLLSHRDHR